MRNGSPYFIEGAGVKTESEADRYLSRLVEAGGNSVRTWGITGDMKPFLDRAHARGLSVSLGLWLLHEDDGINYLDTAAVRRQFETTRKAVLAYKDHPALLLWGVGNEVEMGGARPELWQAINEVAAMIHQLDPNHPTMAVVADIDANKIDDLKRYCPEIDILGVNSYGGIGTLPERLADYGWDKPYIVTEFGTNGDWQADRTPWDAPIMPSSTERAALYREGYRRAVADQPNLCLGSYVFFWAAEKDLTALAWFNLFLADGCALDAVQVMEEAWTGVTPANQCPSILGLSSTAGESALRPGARFRVRVTARANDGDTLAYTWLIARDNQGRLTPCPDGNVSTSDATPGAVTVLAPRQPGDYRLMAFVSDGTGYAATANLPFSVRPSP